MAPLIGPRIITETPSGTIWQLQSSENTSAWQLMQTFTNVLGISQAILDTGQSGQLPAGSANCRFYRIIPL